MIRRLLILGTLLWIGAAVCIAQTAPTSKKLTLHEAEDIALKNNPAISVAKLSALASQQITRGVRAAYFPSSSINLTGVDSLDNSRITAGGLNNPIIYPRIAEGVTVSQLVTDFGRTPNLVASARFGAMADDESAQATVAQIKLGVNQAFYGVLQSQAVLKVAEQTVSARQILAEQVGALTRSKLKSDLDLSFANVNLAQAQLLLLDAQNQQNASLAALSEILGFATQQDFDVVDDTDPTNPPTTDLDSLVDQAAQHRPELASLQFEWQSAQKFRDAEQDLFRPSIRAVGTVGEAPIRADQLSNRFGAVGFNVEIPIFNGFLFNARSKEADLKAQAANQRLLELRNRVARDVHTAWLDANTAYSRLSVTKQLLDQANLALELAQTRYNLGLGSIVELSQAQVQATEGELGDAAARYLYRLAEANLRFQTGSL
jgi:outer membrane protein